MHALSLSIIFIVLILGVITGFAMAAKQGYTVPPAICLAIILAGALSIVAPLAFSFLLQVLSRPPQFTEGERSICWIAGTVMTFLGIIASVFSRRSGTPPRISGS